MLQKITNLANACAGKEVEIGLLQRNLECFGNYVQAVVTMEYMMPIIMATTEGEQFKEKVTEYDYKRKLCHDAAIDACNILNRLSIRYGLEPFYTGSTDDRHEVAEFTGKIVSSLYYNGIHRGKSFDELVTAVKIEGGLVKKCPDIKEDLEI